MKIEKLVGNYYINDSIIKKVTDFNNELQRGITFDFRDYNGSLLDFFQNNFCYFRKNNFLTHELLFFNYFISESDRIELKIKNFDNKVLLDIDDTAYNVFLGPSRTNFLNLGWIFSQSGKGIIIEIKKKEQEFNFIEDLDFITEEYLEFLMKELIHSNTLKDENFRISSYHLDGTFIEKLEKYSDIFQKSTKYKEVSNKINQGVESFRRTGDLFYIFNCIGINRKNFWKEEFLTKTK